MDPFTVDHWVMLALAFLLGLFIGMYLLAGGKWKRRYREEVRRREALEAERSRWQARDPGADARLDPARADEVHYREPLPDEGRKHPLWGRRQNRDRLR